MPKSQLGNGDDLDTLLLNLLRCEEYSIDGYYEYFHKKFKGRKNSTSFVFEEASNELKNIVEFLNNQVEHTEVFIIKVKLFQNENGFSN